MVYLLKMVIFHGELLVITRWYILETKLWWDYSPSSWKRLVQSFNALQIHQLGKPERQQPQLRHFLLQSKILVNKWASQRGDRAKFYLVEHVQYIYIYIRLYIYLYTSIIYIYIIYMCVCLCTSTNQSKTHKIGGEKKSHACRATPRPAMLSRCLKKAKPRPGPCLHNETSAEKNCYI